MKAAGDNKNLLTPTLDPLQGAQATTSSHSQSDTREGKKWEGLYQIPPLDLTQEEEEGSRKA